MKDLKNATDNSGAQHNFECFVIYNASPFISFFIFLFMFLRKNNVGRFSSNASWTRSSLLPSTDMLIKSEDKSYKTRILSVTIYFPVKKVISETKDITDDTSVDWLGFELLIFYIHFRNTQKRKMYITKTECHKELLDITKQHNIYS